MPSGRTPHVSFSELFEEAVAQSNAGRPEPSELEALWEKVTRACESATPLRVRILSPSELEVRGERVSGFRVQMGPVSGFLHGYGASWATTGEPPEEVDAWVLRFGHDSDRPMFEFLAFSPKTGPK